MAKRNLHTFLYQILPVATLVSVLVLLATVIIAPISKLFVGIAVAVGVLDSFVSMEELTGGSRLSWLSVVVILVGDFFAYAVSFDALTRTQSWALYLQFVAVVFLTECLVMILLRSRLKAFGAKRNAP